MIEASDTVHGVLSLRAGLQPVSVALESHRRSGLSYAGLSALVGRTVSVLGEAGLGRGDVVAIVLPHGPELGTAILSVLSGAVAAPLNPEYRAEELAREFESLGPSCVIVPAGSASAAREVALARGVAVVELVAEGTSTGEFRLVLPGKVGRSKEVGLRGGEDVALLLHTSGTTSKPKQVPLTHRNLVASMGHLIGSLGLTQEDRCLNLLPLFHIGGIVDVLAAPLAAGGRVLCESPFSVPAYRRGREAFAPTWTQLAPAMLRELVDAGERGPGSLRFVRSVSAALPVELLERAEAALGVPVVEIYGMTETAGVIASNPLPPGKRKAGSVGVSAGPEVAVVDGQGERLAAGTRGEVVVRGPSVMKGYAGGEEANAGVWVGEWLRTGDEGYLDGEGYLFLTGRMKEIINRGGEKVSPHEVDEVLRSHPAVAEAAAFALAHPVLGEEVGAAVVLRAGRQVEARELVEYARARLAYFKVPRVVKVVSTLPRTAGGKLRRHELAAQVGAGQESGPVQAAYVEPATALQRELARHWAAALGVERVGADDDFFALGGDSLKAAGFVNRIESDHGEVLYVTSLFDAPTLARYEAFLRERHPVLAARIDGVEAPATSTWSVDDARLASFRAAIAPTLRAPAVPRERLRPAVFVLSPPRSGSTLLRAMFAGHPRLFAPPELYLLPFDTLAERRDWFAGAQRFQLEGLPRALMQLRGIDADAAAAVIAHGEAAGTSVAASYAELQHTLGDRLLVDKTPYYASRPETLAHAETLFRDARYIHLVRHPCAMIRSFDEASLGQLWYPRLVGPAAGVREACPWPSLPFAEMLWNVLHANIVDFLAGVPAERQHRLAFEDLVRDPEGAMRTVAGFLRLDYEPAMLEPQRDRQARMTDGLREQSRMIGDMKFHRHASIDPGVADRWRDTLDESMLSASTLALARALGYAIEDPAEREVFEL